MIRTHIAILLIVYFASLDATHAGFFWTQDELDRSVAFATDPRFASVGSVHGFESDGTIRRASGVLVAPDWVLMSGHQVFQGGSQPKTNFEFRLGNDYNNPFVTRTSSLVITHPGWTGDDTAGSFWGAPDLALLKLSSPIIQIPFAERFRGVDIINPDHDNRTQLYMAGFGQHGIVNQSILSDSIMRAGSNRLDEFGPLFPIDINLVTWSTSPASSRKVDLEWQSGPGDSGGGWFQNVGGEFQLSGITSFAGLPFGSQSHSGAVRVSRFNDWIDSNITAVPEPSSMVLLGIVSGFGLLVHRKRRSNKAMDRSRGSREI